MISLDSRRPLAPLRAAFLAACYGAARPERVVDVEAQLDAVLSADGAKVRRGVVVRVGERELARALADTLAEFRRGTVKNPDRAIVIALRKCEGGKSLADLDAAGRTPSEAQAARAADDGAAADAEYLERQRRADTWAAANAARFAERRAAVVAEFGIDPALELPRDAKPEGIAARVQRIGAAAALVAACLREAEADAQRRLTGSAR